MPVQPRRTFAPSFVLTVVGSLATASAAPAPPPRKPPEKKPPEKKPPTPAPIRDRHWQIYQEGDKCWADSSADACPPPGKDKVPVSCNPPAPTPYACPAGESFPFNLVQRAGSTQCFVDPGPSKCPPNVACNPPRPRQQPCP
jgi:hypothetical protein